MTAEDPLSPTGIEQGRFKRTADGWLFAATPPRPFGPHPIYRVSEAQRAALIARLRRVKYLRLLVVFVLIVPLAAVLSASPAIRNPASPAGWIALVVLTALGVAISAACEYTIVKRPLRGLRPTGARLTFGDRLRMQADALPLKTHVLFATVFLFGSASGAYRAVAPLHGPGSSPFALTAAVAFALLFLRSAMLIAVKLAPPRSGEA